MRGLGKVIIAGIMLLVSHLSWAQTSSLQRFRIEHLTVESGLSSNSIYSLFQDEQGFVWVGTADGLNRYDGYEFVAFRYTQSDTTSISDNFISQITQTQDLALWIGTQGGGINRYDTETGRFSCYPSVDDSTQQTLPSSYIYSVWADEEDGIWVGTDEGLGRISSPEQVSDLPEFPDTNNRQGVESILTDKQGNVWFGSGSGLYVLSIDSQAHIKAIPEAKDIGPIKYMITDQQGRVWIGAKKGLYWVEEGQFHSLSEHLDSGAVPILDVVALAEGFDGKLWIGTRDGLTAIDLYSSSTEDELFSIELHQLVEGSVVTSLLADREGNLWVGTANSGIIRLLLSRPHFPYYQLSSEASPQGATQNTIRTLYEDRDGSLWVGTYGAGLFHIDRSGQSLNHFIHDSEDPNSLPGNIISCIYRDQNGILWIGTWGDGLARASLTQGNLSFKRFFQQTGLPGTLTDNSIHQLFEDEWDNLWVVTNGSIEHFDPQTERFTPISQSIDYSSKGLNRVIEDRHNRWWIGSWSGLYVLDSVQVTQLKTGQPVTDSHPAATFTSISGTSTSLSNDRITSLLEDREGRLWIGTYGGGLNEWIPPGSTDNFSLQEGSFRSFGIDDGLPNAVIYGILEDQEGKLWLSTNGGLVRFAPDSATVQVFTKADGLQSDHFYFGAFGKTAQEELLFGGINGFNLIETDSLPGTLTGLPKVTLVDFQIRGESAPVGVRPDGTTIMQQSIWLHPQIRLQPNDNAFQFKFTSLNFEQASNIDYHYRMVGYEDLWQQTDADNRYAAYTNLPHGDYTFEVRASFDGHQWGEPQTVRVKILPRWYQTFWARGMLGASLIGLGVLFSMITTSFSQLKDKLTLEQVQREREKELYETKSWFYTFISHEFRTPITLIYSPLLEIMQDRSIPNFIREKVEFAFQSARRLRLLVNQFLSFQTAEVGKLQLEAVEGNIVDFIHEIFLAFSNHAHRRNIRFLFTSETDQIMIWFDREKMEMAIYNLISNALNYTSDGGTVRIRLTQTDESCTVEVKDTGKGISAEKLPHIFEPFFRATEQGVQGTGIGLTVVKQVIDLHHGTITVESQPGKGSLFHIHFPLGKAHLTDQQIQRPFSDTEDPLNYQQSIRSQSESEQLVSLFEHLSFESRPSLLLVDDNADIRSYIRNHFKEEFEVYEAKNGVEGLELANAHIPDLIISDIIMPEMDGLTMCRSLKTEIMTSHIPVILLSSRTSVVHQIEGLQTGGYEYVTKPFDINLLYAKVVSIFKNLRNLHEYYEKAVFLTSPNMQGDDSVESQFVYQAATIVENHLADQDFDVDRFAHDMGISRSGLYKKLHSITGKSTTGFIRFIRLRHAEKLIKSTQLTISEISYQVGFNNPRYFRKCFREEFEVSPSELRA